MVLYVYRRSNMIWSPANTVRTDSSATEPIGFVIESLCVSDCFHINVHVGGPKVRVRFRLGFGGILVPFGVFLCYPLVGRPIISTYHLSDNVRG